MIRYTLVLFLGMVLAASSTADAGRRRRCCQPQYRYTPCQAAQTYQAAPACQASPACGSCGSSGATYTVPQTCPLWDLGELEAGGDHLYYAEYWPQDCNYSESTWVIGNYPGAPLLCDYGCIVYTSPANKTIAGNFPDEFQMPAGKWRRNCTRLEPKVKVAFDHDANAGTPYKVAYIHKFQVKPRVLANGKQPYMRFGFETRTAAGNPAPVTVHKKLSDQVYQVVYNSEVYLVHLQF
jgi:hypothetical protein